MSNKLWSVGLAIAVLGGGIVLPPVEAEAYTPSRCQTAVARHLGANREPNFNSRIFFYVPPNVVLHVSGEQNNFYQVTYEGKVGWIHKSLMDCGGG